MSFIILPMVIDILIVLTIMINNYSNLHVSGEAEVEEEAEGLQPDVLGAVNSMYIYIYIYIYMCIHMFICTCIYVCMYVCMYMCVYIYIYVSVI